jgi:hypothetical protein
MYGYPAGNYVNPADVIRLQKEMQDSIRKRLANPMGPDQQLPSYPPPPPKPKRRLPKFISRRALYKVEELNTNWKELTDEQVAAEEAYHTPVAPEEANLVGSKTDLEPGGHLPVIDLDLPCHLEPSTTPGHYHLYINQVVEWDKFLNILKALYEAGIVQEGFYEMSKRRGQAFVRVPGVKKNKTESDS